jgi:hypothetical protein
MGLWDTAPSFNNPPTFNDLEDVKKYLKDNINKIARSLQDIDFIINGTLNVDNIKANGIETKNLKAGAVTAEKITVSELSAISADLGKITAGEIFGAYIASREAAYPRAELKSSGDVFAAFYDADNYIAVESDYFGVPSLNFFQGGTQKGRLDTISSLLEIVGLGGLILFASGGDLQLDATGVVKVQSWDKFYNSATNRTLQQDLDDIDSNFAALASLYDSLDARVTALETP